MRLRIFLFCTASIIGTAASAAEQCGELGNAFGPFDYRNEKGNLPIVEGAHFDANVERLVRGKTGALGGDIDYVLRAYPNHHRALVSMENLSNRLKMDQPPQASYTISCYYDRAIRFRPDDGVVRALYANFLARRGKPTEAIKQLEAAEKSLGPSANLHYNMGLIYTDLKQYDKALEHAHQAYQLGFNLPGLKAKLQRAGQWREPAPLGAAKTQKPAAGSSQAEARAGAPSQADGATANTEATSNP
jgi:tetratricopeptide (TPR) repeat protein